VALTCRRFQSAFARSFDGASSGVVVRDLLRVQLHRFSECLARRSIRSGGEQRLHLFAFFHHSQQHKNGRKGTQRTGRGRETP
jgi:hypothetical protein